jgi:hypothetical protein
MPEGQRLRWWQEEESNQIVSQRASERIALDAVPLPTVTAKPPGAVAAEPVTLTEEYQDTWEDLEAEAVRRVQQAKQEEAESVSFFLEKSSALVKHRRQGRIMGWSLGSIMLLLIAIPLVIFLTSSHHHHIPPNFGFIGGFAGAWSMYYRRRKWLEEKEKPTIRLSNQGLSLHTPLYADVTLPWNEIVEIKPKGNKKRRYLEIRASKRRRFVIEGRDLPIPADTLATRIAVYETGRI